MIVRKGFFTNDSGKKVSYQIDEKLTDGKVSLYFSEIGEIYHYTRRKDKYNIEVKIITLKVEPKIERKLDEYEKFINEFYKENLKDRISSDFFTCSVDVLDNSYKINYYDFYKNDVNEYLENTKMKSEELAEYIYRNKKSPYSRS